MNPNRDLSTLTPGEKLWLARRRKGLSGAEAAARAGLGKNAWYDVEADRRPSPGLRAAGFRAYRPTLPELLALARRRAGCGLDDFAAYLGTSRPTALAWERAGAAAVRNFWRAEGFRFP